MQPAEGDMRVQRLHDSTIAAWQLPHCQQPACHNQGRARMDWHQPVSYYAAAALPSAAGRGPALPPLHACWLACAGCAVPHVAGPVSVKGG